MSAGVWLDVSHIADLYATAATKQARYEQVRNWWRRGRVEHRMHYGTRQINAESVERYLKTRNPDHIRTAYRKGAAA